jgi:Transposase DDE domain
VLEAVQRRLDTKYDAVRERRATVEHPFGTIKAGMGATHFLMKTLPRVASEMALHVLADNLTRVSGAPGSARAGAHRTQPSSDEWRTSYEIGIPSTVHWQNEGESALATTAPPGSLRSASRPFGSASTSELQRTGQKLPSI